MVLFFLSFQKNFRFGFPFMEDTSPVLGCHKPTPTNKANNKDYSKAHHGRHESYEPASLVVADLLGTVPRFIPIREFVHGTTRIHCQSRSSEKLAHAGTIQ